MAKIKGWKKIEGDLFGNIRWKHISKNEYVIITDYTAIYKGGYGITVSYLESEQESNARLVPSDRRILTKFTISHTNSKKEAEKIAIQYMKRNPNG